MNIASAFSVLAHKWLTALGENAQRGADHVIREALEIVKHVHPVHPEVKQCRFNGAASDQTRKPAERYQATILD